jgi:diadenosine tetraphosphate (Ap4A) HIT family hydrolase
MSGFQLDPRLAADSRLVVTLGLTQLRLMDDARWPWLILIPQRPRIEEIFDMTPLDQTMLTFEAGLAATALKQATGCAKINIGALGNKVRQFHLHVIARNEGDANWPGPVWGHGVAEPWKKPDRDAFVDRLMGAL